MRWVRAVISLILVTAAFWALDNRHGAFPALGRLLDPFAGFWRNGDRSDVPPEALKVPGLRDEVRVVWDTRHVPHIFARNDYDLYLAQGYVAASLRLWQMEFQAFYTAGRISEVVGEAGLRSDRLNRRYGLPWAAENSLRFFRADPKSRETVEAFTAGVNAYIRGLGRRRLPVEYKILDYRPEPWTDMKCALLLKGMAYTLSFFHQEAAMTWMKEALGEAAVDALFPYVPPLVDPVIPPGTPLDFEPVPLPPPGGAKEAREGAGGVPAPARGPGPAWPELPPFRPGPGVGSNNWAVSGRLARDGFPILCNDMHLGLSLPAIWYEVQLSAPGVNVRGVAFPASPLVIAGYNESVAWGFTNGTDDVLDWYGITFRDGSRAEYLFGGEWRKTTVREETIRVRGGGTVVDRVIYTHHGPVVRLKDEADVAPANVPPDAALRWLAHDPSNELLALHALNRARGYGDYVEAVKTWDCPSQNIVYADRDGTVAVWHSGKFPLRRKGQGRYVLDGSDPADAWKDWVPRGHVPHVKDPERGFVSSANQLYAGPDYPYYLGWDYAPFERGARINELLWAARGVAPEDMVRMQADVLDIRARTVLPALLQIVGKTLLTGKEKKAFEELRSWNYEARAAFIAPTVFREFWSELNRMAWDDERREGAPWRVRPASQVMADLLVNHPDSGYFDDKATPGRETLADLAGAAFRSAVEGLEKRLGPYGEAWRWGKVKGTRIGHIASIPGFGRERVEADGAGQVINAIDSGWAPSWRMVVELGPRVRAWGTYPGGQSGNPGSRFYDDFIDDWAAGRPAELVFLGSADEAHPAVVARTVMRGRK